MSSTDFLNSIGVLVSNATDVKVGDIVGHASSAIDVRLYYVERVAITPTPPCLMPHVPRVSFKAPHVGIAVDAEGKLRHWSIHMPMPAEQYKYSWADYSNVPGDEMAEIDKDEIYADLVKSEIFDMYLITNEQYQKLGSLIPKVEVPSWGILAQTTLGEGPIFDFVDAIQEDLKQAREAHERIKARVYATPYR